MYTLKDYGIVALFCVGIIALLSFHQKAESFGDIPPDSLLFVVPAGWPDPLYDFERNPLTQEGFELGRALFYDPGLSRDSTISCASCHLVFTGFTHIDHALSHGIEDRIGDRNTLAIINPAWQPNFRWDGGIDNIDEQPLDPLESPVEMDHDMKAIIAYLKESKKYPEQFKAAFGARAKITEKNLLKALSQFMIRFVSCNSKYDKVMREEEGVSFNEREEKGLMVFRQHCASCHTEPLFTNFSFQNNGLPIDTLLHDGGRIRVTGLEEDSLKFRVPTLRNIAVTYPYMHDGRFRSLQMVLHHYTAALDSTINIAEQLREPLPLTEDDKRNLVIFLKTLTDRSFLYNPELRFPKK